jgi:hypothetical protein
MEIFVSCPHCEELILIYKNEINCAIFRHGVKKSNLKQINPHLPKDVCDILARNNQIYGCGKPFKLIINNDEEYTAIKCDYI